MDTGNEDLREQSRQWLGKPYNAQQERIKRKKIPEPGNIDFAERRARIQKAIAQNLEQPEMLTATEYQGTRSNGVGGMDTPRRNISLDEANAHDRDVSEIGMMKRGMLLPAAGSGVYVMFS